MEKRILSVCLTACMLLTLMPSAFAADAEQPSHSPDRNRRRKQARTPRRSRRRATGARAHRGGKGHAGGALHYGSRL